MSIKQAVIVWYEKQFSNIDEIRIAKDTDEVLIIDFDFTDCMAQLTVSNSKYNPYQYVFFEAIEVEDGNQIYSFYDNENMLQADIEITLEKAYRFCANYKTD